MKKQKLVLVTVLLLLPFLLSSCYCYPISMGWVCTDTEPARDAPPELPFCVIEGAPRKLCPEGGNSK